MAIFKYHEMELIKLILTLIGITGLSFGIFATRQSSLEQGGGEVKLTPPTIELPEGVTEPFSSRAQRYFIRSESYPLFTEAILDPFDVKKGETQKVIIKIQNREPVQSVNVLLKTDNSKKTYQLTLVGGTPLDGVWRGSWGIDDTHEKIYSATLQASATNSNSSVDLIFK